MIGEDLSSRKKKLDVQNDLINATEMAFRPGSSDLSCKIQKCNDISMNAVVQQADFIVILP